MRLTLKFLIKSFIVVVVLLFLLPLLINQLDSKEQQKAKVRKRDGVKHPDETGLKFQGLEAPGAGDQENPEGVEQQQQPPVHHMEIKEDKVQDARGRNEDQPQKTYGPKAVFKDGILGNFEPRNYGGKSGPGENGEPVYTSMEEKATADRSTREFGFNMVASDKIAMDRSVPDTRLEECKYWTYPEDLPTASVIIVFHNEGWSTLMRTVHSVINMSPPNLLKEVVMVDDFSDKEHLKGRLDEYVKQFNGLVKVYRNKERLGLILTRSEGAKYATGDVIVFLDAHCECNRNWLTPLLARIKYDRTIMAVPIVDSISWENFRYRPTYRDGTHYRGIFEWGFLYKESRVPEKELSKREKDSEPYWSPTHAGGLFAMDRNYFNELGGYDPGLQIWGGENFELSFKIWQCGGSIEWVPCSRVGHVYRNSMPYGFGKISPKIPIILLNYMRVVEVWLDDEFKEYFYTREPTIRGYPIGDISQQLEFKAKHQCKSFKWFMDNIAYEVYEKFPPPPPNVGWGEIKTQEGNMCFDTMGQRPGASPIGTSSCHHFGGNQMFRLNSQGQMAVGERCIDSHGGGISITYCPVQPTGPWKLDPDTGLLKHTSQNKCAQAESGNKLTLRSCDTSSPTQKWEINNIKTWDS